MKLPKEDNTSVCRNKINVDNRFENCYHSLHVTLWRTSHNLIVIMKQSICDIISHFMNGLYEWNLYVLLQFQQYFLVHTNHTLAENLMPFAS